MDYFFSDLKIEFISQLGKFFCAPAFSLLQRNFKKSYNLNINENLNNISSDNNLLISNTNSCSSSNMAGLNTTELSVNGYITAMNQNSTYYLDLDFLPLEENNNLGLINFKGLRQSGSKEHNSSVKFKLTYDVFPVKVSPPIRKSGFLLRLMQIIEEEFTNLYLVTTSLNNSLLEVF